MNLKFLSMKKLTIFLAFLLFVGFQAAAQMQISGTVTSTEDGLSIPGVSIVVEGNPTIGTTTDIDGKYNLTVPSSAETLIFSFVGMEAQNVTINGRSMIDLQMESAVLAIDEVFVVAYGTTKKESFTGSAASINAEKLAAVPVVSIDQSIAGYIPGVQSGSSSGQPGSLSNLRIRGTGSINSSSEPLYIIDGVAMVTTDVGSFGTSSSSALASLNPNDIKSITVLKDAAAASLYGSRAANGVILITTKSGKSGDTKFSFKAETGSSNFAIPLAELASPAETYEYKLEARENQYLYYGYTAAQAAQGAQDDMAFYFPTYDPNRPDSDYNWRDRLFRTGKTNSYELNASGGTESTTFYTSFSSFSSEGVAVGSDYERLTGRLKLDHKANDYLTFGINASVDYTEQNTIPSNSLYYKNPMWATNSFLVNLVPIENLDGSYSEIQGGSYPNLAGDAGKTMQKDKIYHSSNQIYAEIDIIEGLKFRSTLGYDFRLTKGHQYWSPASNDGASYDGYVFRDDYARTLITNTNLLTYSKTIADKHTIGILIGEETEDYSYEDIAAAGQGFPNDYTNTLDVSATPLTAYSHTNQSVLNSYFSKLDYNFDNKYYVSGSYRRDGSSRFGADTRWGNFWSVSGSWRVSEEAFLSNLNWLNNWKIRGSYGVNGNLPTARQGSLALYEYGYGYNGTPGMTNAQIENKDLKWEKNSNLSIATDIKVFDFLSLEVEYFSRVTSDLLLQVPVSRVTGFSTYWANIGEMKNTGIEATLGTVNVSKGDFVWTTDFTFYHYKNEIVKLYNGEDIQDFPFILREGESFNTFYVRDWAGVNPETGAGQWYVLDEDENRVDVDGDGLSDVTESTGGAAKGIVGCADPDLIGSINNTLSYKGFDFSFLFTYKIGGDSYGDLDYYLYADGENVNNAVTKVAYDDRWQNPGDNKLPIVIQANPQHTNYNSSRRLHDASYLRLKNITLAYNLPKAWAQKVKLDNVKVYATGVNLWTWAAYDQYDPEVSIRGVGLANADFPSLKTYTFGIQIGF
jgi:TonB-linked SusC/RagA family outer membrane protein